MLPSILALKQLNQLPAASESVKVVLTWKVNLLVLDVPFLLIFRKRLKDTGLFREETRKTLVSLGILSLLGIFIFTGISGNVAAIKNQELYSHHIRDIKDVIIGSYNVKAKEELLTQEDIIELKTRAKLKYGKHTGIGKGKNLIVIQVEALQDFVIGLEYKGQEITPNLNRFIKDSSSIYYDQYYQLIGSGNTSDAEFVSHNSLYPTLGEPIYNKYTENTFYGLPWLLRDNNYTTWALHGYVKEFWNRDKAYVGQGFQRFISEEDFDFPVAIGFGLRDEEFFDQSVDFIKELKESSDKPFYTFMVTLTSHTPFVIPEEYHELELEQELMDNMIGNYFQAIHYTDKHFGHFLERLKEEGLYDDTVIALYGDHFAIKADQEEATLLSDLLGMEYDYDEMMHIPLVIHVPGEDIKETISTVGSHLDFYPTIANIMGLDNEKGLVFGRDLTNYDGETYVAPQTYLPKGSFISRDILFEMSKDGIFEHSRAVNRITREEVDLEPLKDISEKLKLEIDKSTYILENDLLKDIID